MDNGKCPLASGRARGGIEGGWNESREDGKLLLPGERC